MKFLFWILLTAHTVSTAAERKSVAPQPMLDPKGARTQTINTAPITIHVPIPKSYGGAHEPSAAPAAIAAEAPEGTYLLPVTEQSKERPPAVNLVLNLRLVMDGEKKPEQSEAVTVVTEPTSPPAVKANPGEYVAHEVKIVTPNAMNPSPTPTSSTGFQGGIVQGDTPAATASQGNGLNVPRQSAKNYGVAPSFLLIPKRRVLHNVRSNMKATVHGSPLARFRQQFIFEHNKKRLFHGVPPLTQDPKLNAEAQNLAIELAKQRNTTHSLLKKRVGHGENIALRCSFKGSPLTGARATNLWYDESKKFNWKVKSFTPATERFTQMVWKNTTKVGFGRAQFTDKNGRICFVVVARYEPAANVGEALLDNVLEPIKLTRKHAGRGIY